MFTVTKKKLLKSYLEIFRIVSFGLRMWPLAP